MIFESRMYRYFLKAILIFTLGFMTGCMPFPTKNVDTPKIEGNIYSDESELSGYSIFLAYDVSDACSTKKAIKAITGLNGHFVFPQTFEWSLIRWAVPLDGYAVFNLCIVNPSGVKKWAYVSHIRTPSWAPDIKLSCSYEELLAKPEEIDRQKIFEIEVGCRPIQDS